MSSEDFSPDKPMSIDNVAFFFKEKNCTIYEKKCTNYGQMKKKLNEGMCVFQGF